MTTTKLRYLDGVSTLELDVSRCTGCRVCTLVCPHAVLEMADGRARIVDRDACMECGACVTNCASEALSVDAGVGCASAIVRSWIFGGEPSCGCEDAGGSGSGSGGCC
jgi:ferredoxin